MAGAMEPRQHPWWLRTILNLCGPVGLGATLLGWVRPVLGVLAMLVGFAYVAWEVWPYLSAWARRRKMTSLVLCISVGAIIGGVTGFAAWKKAVSGTTHTAPSTPAADGQESAPATDNGKAQLLFTFRDPLNEMPKLETTVSVKDNVAVVRLTVKTLGDIPARNGKLFIRLCERCSWVEAPHDFLAEDGKHSRDRSTEFRHLLPGTVIPTMEIKVGVPDDPIFDHFNIEGFYTCDNCPPVDAGKPQRLLVNLIREPQEATKLPKPKTDLSNATPFATSPDKKSNSHAISGNNNTQVGGAVTAAPCSSVQIGGNGNQANINCVSPARHLTKSQNEALGRVAESLPANSDFLHIEWVNEPETIRYGREIADYFAYKTSHIGAALSWGQNAPPEGINVIVDGEKDPLFPTAQRIADAFAGSGIPVNFTNFDSPKPGTIYIVIGTALQPKRQ